MFIKVQQSTFLFSNERLLCQVAVNSPLHTRLKNLMSATIPLLKEGRYSIEHEFSSLGNASRFQAFDTVNEAAVTVVEVPLRLPKVATAAQRESYNSVFEQQAQTLKGLSHKSLIAVKDHFSEAGRHYLVTDLIDGLDLNSHLKDRKKPFSVTEVVEWANSILEALSSLHMSRPPVYFSAMRPENLILRADGTVGVAVSAAVICGDASASSEPDDSVAYSPLEQLWSGLDAASQKVIINKYDEASERVLKQDLDARSDIYSLGATLYHLVTGRRPSDVLERSIEIIEGNADPLKSPHKLDSSIPTEISDVIMKAMEIKREYRFDSAAIMRQVLKTAVVRVKEREEEDARELEEAAEDLKQAARAKLNGNVAAKTEIPAATPQDEVTPPVVERQKPEVTENAAPEPVAEKPVETDTKPFEPPVPQTVVQQPATPAPQTARPTEAFSLDDDLLGLMSPSVHTSGAPEAKVAQALPVNEIKAEQVKVVEVSEEAVPEIETAAAEEEAVVFSSAPIIEAQEVKEPEIMVEPEEVVEVAVDVEPHELDPSAVTVTEVEAEEVIPPVVVEIEKIPAAAAITPVEVKSAEVEKVEPVAVAQPVFKPTPVSNYEDLPVNKGGLPVGAPALAAIVAIFAVIALGGWMFLGGSSEDRPSTPAAETRDVNSPVSAPQSAEPSQNALQSEQPGSMNQPAATQSEQPAFVDNKSETQKAGPAAATQPKPKKAAPAPSKSPAQKKPVTVDDLINDN